MQLELAVVLARAVEVDPLETGLVTLSETACAGSAGAVGAMVGRGVGGIVTVVVGAGACVRVAVGAGVVGAAVVGLGAWVAGGAVDTREAGDAGPPPQALSTNTKMTRATSENEGAEFKELRIRHLREVGHHVVREPAVTRDECLRLRARGVAMNPDTVRERLE